MIKGKHSSKKGIGGKPHRDHGKYQSSNGKTKDALSKQPDSPEDCILTFPDLETVDKNKLPCYSQVLTRNKDDVLGMEDLDRLQLELETLLTAVAVRIRDLHTEIEALNSAEERRDKKGKLLLAAGMKKRNLEDKSKSKSLKESLGASAVVPATSNISHGNTTLVTDGGEDLAETSPVLSPDPTISEPPKIVVPKNDTTHKFWASIEPYCAEVTPEDLKYLQELIANFEKEAEIQKVPPLGRHYTLRWAEEDLSDERDASSATKSKVKPTDDVKDMLKRAERICVRDKTPGPLVQRLVSALLEETQPSPLQESFAGNKLKDKSSTGDNEGMESPAKKINLGTSSPDLLATSENKTQENLVPGYLKKLPLYHTSACFERRIRRELEAAGFIDTHETPKEDDEILAEIKKCQDELRAIALHNVEQLKNMLKLAQIEYDRQQMKKKIKQFDTEILDVYKKVVAYKLKKKPFGKKEREQAWKALKDREALLKSLEQIE